MIKLLKFDECLTMPQKSGEEFDEQHWIYAPKYYMEYRYLLGTRGDNPIICIGINPSTARPNDLDNTLKSVERLAIYNGYDSFLMLNISPERATDPNEMSYDLANDLKKENINAFKYVLGLSKSKTVWLANGTLIEKRPYLRKLLGYIYKESKLYDIKWVSAGKISKKGHPHHPLYLRKDEEFKAFDIDKYMEILRY